MATGKKYYWIKIKDTFMTSDKVDYLMSQPNGAEYVVLYQMLCLKCINTDGVLARKIGEVIIPFDDEKIQRDCKYFKIDTVREALRLFAKLGMIYQETDGYLRIIDFENMVGSETDWAAQKRRQIKNESKNPTDNPVIEGNISANCGINVESGVENLHTDNRDKILDNSISINTNTSKSKTLPESRNDLEKIERTYFELWDSLYQKGAVSTEKPIIDYGKIRKLERGLLEDKLNPISVESIQKAIHNSVNHTLCIQSGYSLQVILSKSVINQLLNGSAINNSQQSKPTYQQSKQFKPVPPENRL